MTKKNITVQKTFDFSVAVMEFTEELRKLRKYELSSQFLKRRTSIGANGGEAQNVENKKDIIHKPRIFGKRSRRTLYWLNI